MLRYPAPPPINYLTNAAKHTIRIIAIVAASLSMLTAMVTFYFFWRMPKRFRHILIIINILGDLVRAISYFMFSVAALSGYPRLDNSPLCQATGFLISLGHESTDFSVLFIAIHGAMQITRPVIDPYDERYGLMPYRYFVYACLLFIPVTLASLAWATSGGGYVGSTFLCWLPIRPLWYRLVLSWIPRYLIFLSIIGITAFVYSHVRKQFGAFQGAWDGAEKARPAIKTWAIEAETEYNRPRKVSFSAGGAPGQEEPTRERRSSLPEFFIDVKRRFSFRRHASESGVNTNDIRGSQENDISGPTALFSYVRQDSWGIPTIQLPGVRRESAVTMSSNGTDRTSKTMPVLPSMISGDSTFRLPPDAEALYQDPSRHIASSREMLEAKRRQVMSQLRTNFVYPCIYISFWMLPFTLHCMQYRRKYAISAPPVLVALSTISLVSMGWVNSLCFLIREKPWNFVGIWPKWFRSDSDSDFEQTVNTQDKQRRSSALASDVTGRLTVSGSDSGSGSGSGFGSGLTPPETRRASGAESNSSTRGSSSHRPQLASSKSSAKSMSQTGTQIRPISAKQGALLRLHYERTDRRSVIRTANLSECSDTPGYGTAVIDSQGVGAQRNWWDSPELEISNEDSESDVQ